MPLTLSVSWPIFTASNRCIYYNSTKALIELVDTLVVNSVKHSLEESSHVWHCRIVVKSIRHWFVAGRRVNCGGYRATLARWVPPGSRPFRSFPAARSSGDHGHSPRQKKLGRRRTSAQRSDHSAMIVMTMLATSRFRVSPRFWRP